MRYALLFLLFLSLESLHAQRPRIGLTLSGGGAKGLAHIGILKALDSAGLKVDYITGTSMGSIIGALYAAGYSADSIEYIARHTNWDLLLSNQSNLRTLFMEEKDEYNKYIVELPWVNNNFRLPSGLLEAEELWIKLSELFFPVYNRKNFSDFSIPFRCIGTDVGSGEAVVMDSGEIAAALRSSVAIPSFFTAVDYNGHRLVDGGLVRNFPVRDVKAMGADFVIGSNVASGLLPSAKVRNVIQVLLQVAFFREAIDNKQEVPLCDIYVPFELDKYSMGSFSQSKEILDSGLAVGRQLYPRFKAIADSLNALYGADTFQRNRLPPIDRVLISGYEVHGLERTSSDFFIHTTNLEVNRYYTAAQLSQLVRSAFGTRYYSRVIYSLQPLADGSCRIRFDVTENPLTFAKLGLHYSRFTGIAAILNITSRNFFITNSRSMLTFNLGDNFRIRGEHLQYLGRRKNFSLVLNSQYDRFDVATYNTYKQDGLYKQQFFKADGKFQYSTQRNLSVGLGERFEWVKFKPAITSSFQFTGDNNFFSTYVFLKHNNLDKTIYPHSGTKFDLEAAWVGRQSPDVAFFEGGAPADPDSFAISSDPYPRIVFNFDSYIPLSSRSTLNFQLQSGANFHYSRNIMNEFSIGGLVPFFRNQVLFTGLQEGSLYTPAMASLQAAYRFEIVNNTYVTGRANVLMNNFISKSVFFENPDFLTGYGLSFGYNFALGPLELSVMYCDQSGKLGSFVNIGIPF